MKKGFGAKRGPKGPQKRRRHDRTFPSPPEEEREIAIEDIREKFGHHADPLLVACRTAVAQARRMDAIGQFHVWAERAAKWLAKVPPPPKCEGLTILNGVEMDDQTMRGVNLVSASSGVRVHSSERTPPPVQVDYGQLYTVAAAGFESLNLAVKAELGTLGATLRNPEASAQMELVRDIPVMMGAVALSYAELHKIHIGSVDLANLEMAVGIRINPGEDAGVGEVRWNSKSRKTKIARARELVTFSVDPETKIAAKFFEPS